LWIFDGTYRSEIKIIIYSAKFYKILILIKLVIFRFCYVNVILQMSCTMDHEDLKEKRIVETFTVRSRLRNKKNKRMTVINLRIQNELSFKIVFYE